MTFQITIIGLDQVGASIGLALGNYKDKVVRVGNDSSPDLSARAQKLGAVDKVEVNLPQAVENADLILLCEPYETALKTLETLAPDLTAGKYLFDVGGNKQAFNRKLLQVAPEIKHALNIRLTCNPALLREEIAAPLEPRADCFENGMMIIATSSFTSSEAVDLANTLSGMLKTSLMFCDPVELDGLTAGAQHLPAILSAALIQSSHAQPGWRETRKFTDRDYFAASLPVQFTEGDASPSAEWIENRENIARWIDIQIAELQKIRDLLNASDAKDVDDWWKSAAENRARLLGLRVSGQWDASDKPQTKIPSAKERFASLFTFTKPGKD